VLDRVAAHQDLQLDPHVAVVGLGLGVDHVPPDELPVHHDVRPRRAEIARRTLARALAAQELHLDGRRELLILAHALGRLAVNHQAVVPERPPGTARDLLAHEPVLHAKPVVRKLLLMEQVPELVAELLVLVVGDLQHAVGDPERVVVVLAQVMPGEFRRPALQVLPVEQLNPLLLGRRVLGRHGRRDNQEQGQRHRCDLHSCHRSAFQFGATVLYHVRA